MGQLQEGPNPTRRSPCLLLGKLAMGEEWSFNESSEWRSTRSSDETWESHVSEGVQSAIVRR